LGAILDALVDLGYGWAFRVLDSQHFGVPQRRRRVFVLALLGGDPAARRAAAVLDIAGGSPGDPPAGSETRQDDPGAPPAGLGDLGRDIAYALNAKSTGRFDASVETFVTGPLGTPRGGGHGIGGDEAAGGQLVAGALMAGRGPDRLDPHGAEQNHLVVGALATSGKDAGWRIGSDEAAAGQLVVSALTGNGMGAGGGPDDNAAQAGHLIGATFTGNDFTALDDTAPAIRAGADRQNTAPLAGGSGGVRRLTPVECERLMGWPDGHTERRADGSTIADSHRYRMLGNGVVAPVARWIGQRLSAELALDAD
jgi:DNA (cytosine-5)-methyltransferase 1